MDTARPDYRFKRGYRHSHIASPAIRNGMDTTLWVILAIAAAVAVLYVLVMRVFFRQSKEVDKHIDYSKMRPVEDDKD